MCSCESPWHCPSTRTRIAACHFFCGCGIAVVFPRACFAHRSHMTEAASSLAAVPSEHRTGCCCSCFAHHTMGGALICITCAFHRITHDWRLLSPVVVDFSSLMHTSLSIERSRRFRQQTCSLLLSHNSTPCSSSLCLSYSERTRHFASRAHKHALFSLTSLCLSLRSAWTMCTSRACSFRLTCSRNKLCSLKHVCLSEAWLPVC